MAQTAPQDFRFEEERMNDAPNDPWQVYEYEVDMFKRTLEFSGIRQNYPDPIPNALVESLLLHTRILVDILLSRGKSKDNDDIKLAHLLPGFNPPRVAELKAAYGNQNKKSSTCWLLNKMLAHATTVRSYQRDYTEMMTKLTPMIDDLTTQIAEERKKLARASAQTA
jgi:hypothetical protein